jgi:hypothetical protein
MKVSTNSVTPTQTSSVKEDSTSKRPLNPKLEKFIEEEKKLVKGRFRSFQNPGETMRIQVRKYPAVPMFDKSMTDGEAYEVPLYVARHLNGIDATAEAINGKLGTCSYPVHGFKWDPSKPLPSSTMGNGPDGQGGIPVPLVGVAKRIRRFGFESLEFDELGVGA